MMIIDDMSCCLDNLGQLQIAGGFALHVLDVHRTGRLGTQRLLRTPRYLRQRVS